MSRTLNSNPQSYRFVPRREADRTQSTVGLLLAGLLATASVIVLLAAPPAEAQGTDLDEQHGATTATILHSEEEATQTDDARMQADTACVAGSGVCRKNARLAPVTKNSPVVAGSSVGRKLSRPQTTSVAPDSFVAHNGTKTRRINREA